HGLRRPIAPYAPLEIKRADLDRRGYYVCSSRLSALPNRWISVTAPVTPLARVRPALRIRCPEIARYNDAATSGRVASRYRSANGSDSTHWRIGWRGRTSSTTGAAVSAMRRPPQLGQIVL